MVCRASRLSSAVVTFARDMSGLEDNQVLGLNHALMQEGSQAPAPTVEQWNALISDVQDRYRSGLLTVGAGSHDPMTRLEASRTETPDAQRYYAVQRLVDRATAAAEAQGSYFAYYASALGVSTDHARAEYWSAFSDASQNSRLCATPAFVSAWSANPDNSNLAVDRRSVYAYEQMTIARAAAVSRSASRPAASAAYTFTENPDRPGRGYISAIAHDPATGHTEISWTRDGQSGLTHSYRGLTAADVDALTAPDRSTTREDYFRTTISGRPEYRYENAAAAEAARTAHRCGSCGQFSASSHSCPALGSDEALARDTRAAIAAARATASGERTVPLTNAYRMSATSTRRYDVGNGMVRIPGITRVTAEARARGTVEVPVFAMVDGEHTVNGLVRVDYNGRGNGYTLTPVTDVDDATRARLRCTCGRFTADGSCEHITSTVTRLGALARGEAIATPEQAAAANATVTAGLTEQYSASVTATTASTAAWTAPTVPLAENPAVFQEMYVAARAERQAYQDAVAAGQDAAPFPIAYARENAFGGLATRESGRGFGVEIEFAFPQDMTPGDRRLAIRAIGAELYNAGLTREQNQQGYGASHGWFRDQHARGWSFESDPSTGGSDGQSGGEIVSPVMYDEADTWTNLEKITAVLNRHGAIASRGSGMHVHVSTGDYDHRVENHNRLLQAFAENEDLMYRLSSNTERGRHRGVGYCSPNAMPSSPYTNVGEARRQHNSHGVGLNLQSVSGRDSDHVEFRTFDATLNPAVMQSQVAVAVYMTQGATRPDGPTTPNENRNPLGSRLGSNPRRETLTGDAWNESTLGFRKFLDRFVPSAATPADSPQVRQMVSLFAMTKWQKSSRSW